MIKGLTKKMKSYLSFVPNIRTQVFKHSNALARRGLDSQKVDQSKEKLGKKLISFNGKIGNMTTVPILS